MVKLRKPKIGYGPDSISMVSAMIKFFTLPPEDVDYPFILINANEPNLDYIEEHYRSIKEVIIDTGVEVFQKGLTEYPEGWKRRLEKIVELYYFVKSFPIGKVYAVPPDYPQDYPILPDYPNIEKTIRNVTYAIDHYPEVNWIIPVQGKREKPFSILINLTKYEELGIIKKFNYFAIANLCVSYSVRVIYDTLLIARDYLGGRKKIHSFGLKMQGIAKTKNIIDSTDSTAWTRPCGLVDEILSKVGFPRKSYLSRHKKLYFFAWLYTLINYYDTPLQDVDPNWVMDNLQQEILRLKEESIIDNIIFFRERKINRIIEGLVGVDHG